MNSLHVIDFWGPLILLMISTLVGYVCILGINLLVTNFTGVGDVEMFSMSRLDVVLHGVQLGTLLSTQETGVSSPSVASDKILQLFISL